MLSDGVTPAATGRGYVLRRIIRRMILQTHLLGAREPCLELLYPSVIQTLGGVYPELIERQQMICQILTQEENFFHKIINQGLRVLNEYTDQSEGRCSSLSTPLSTPMKPILPPKLVFSLYDSMGFPFDLTSIYAKKYGYEIDFKAVNLLLEEQRERGRKSWKNLCDFRFLKNDLINSVIPTENISFTGYQHTRESSKLIGFALSDEGEENIIGEIENKKIFICIDPCPFYAEGGGQIGDCGYLQFVTGEKIEILNCVTMNNVNVLIANYTDTAWLRLESHKDYGPPNFIQAVVDNTQRQRASQNHTATHLLNGALRKVLGENSIHQAGSYVGFDRLRFDFTYPQAVTKLQLQQIEKLVRSYIRDNFSVRTKIQSYDDAIANGAISLDSCEKYSDTVRVVEVFDKQTDRCISRELCGGTHVKSTSSISPFIIVNESSVAAGVRRIEALTGELAEFYIEENLNRVQSMAQILGTSVFDIESSTKQLLLKRKLLESQIVQLNEKLLLQSCDAPLCGSPPGETQEMKIHIIKPSSDIVNYDQNDKKAKKLEMNNLKVILGKLSERDPSSVHILLKGKTAICTNSTAKEKLGKLLQCLGGTVKGSGKNFAIGDLPHEVNDVSIKAIGDWINHKLNKF